MDFLTDERDIATISVSELAAALNGERKRIQLPAFQRDAVWDEKRIALLWDSLMRDYPIGSLLFARAKGVFKPVSLAGTAGDTNVEGSTEYIIIDGQQRSNAIALGFKRWVSEDSARLWYDLGAPDNGDGAPQRFFVCTWREPWGIEATGKRRATDSLKRDALAFLDRLFIEVDDDVLGLTWPVAATLPVPVAELISLLGAGKESEWETLVPKAKKGGIGRLLERGDSNTPLEKAFRDLEQISENRVPVYVIEKRSVDELGEIFRRLNTTGVTMSAEDLFFSALKMEWPQAHDLVWEIYNDTGRFLRQTQIVHLAVRLVARADGRDIRRLTPKSFKRFIKARKGDQTYLDSLKVLLKESESDGGNEIGPLHGYLRKARAALEYNPACGKGDPGLPPVLLARLPWRVWHTLAAWFSHHEEIDARSRLEMIRYAFVDHFFTDSKSSALARLPLQIAFETRETFPGFAVYYSLVEAGIIDVPFMTPDEYARKLESAEKPRWSLLHNERDLIMWVQRHYLHKWFRHYDPTLYKSARDLPYDADHILPRAHLNMRGRTRRRVGPPQIFWDYRGPVLHGSGNIRFWPKDLNRSDGRKHLTDKYLLGPADKKVPKDSYLRRRFDLRTVGDVRRAAFLLPDDEETLQFWETASPLTDSYDWNGDRGERRVKAFHEATTRRRNAIFAEFYKVVRWETWKNQLELPQRIREHVLESYMVPSSAEEMAEEIVVSAEGIVTAMHLENNIPLVCAALDSPSFYEEGDVRLLSREGSKYGIDAVWKLTPVKPVN